MNKDVSSILTECPADEIGAYLDRELSPERESRLEAHLAACGSCLAELNRQKSFLLALNETLDNSEIELPPGFTKQVVASAECSVNGLRSRAEIHVALAICASLFLAALIAFEGESIAAGSPATAIFDRAASVTEVVLHLSYNVVFVATSILKTATGGGSGFSILAAVLAAAAVTSFALARLPRSRRLFRGRG